MCGNRFVRLVTIVAICMVSFFYVGGNQVYADDYGSYLSLQINNPFVYNGIYATSYLLDENDLNVRPIIHNDRTMLPMRAVASLFNFDGPEYFDIDWDQSNKTAFLFRSSYDDAGDYMPIAKFQIDSARAVYYKNGVESEATIPTAPVLINSRTYLPLRAIIDAFAVNSGGDDATTIEWVDSKKGIVILFPWDDRPTSVTFPDGTSAQLAN